MSDLIKQTEGNNKLQLTIGLWLFVFLSAVAVIYMTHLSRNAFVEFQAMQAEAQDYEVEWGRLLIEKSNSSSIARMENIASDKLNMTLPDAKRVVVLKGGQP